MDKLLEKKTFKTSRDLTYTYYISAKDSADFTKPTILLQHGFPDDAHLWEKVVPHLQKLRFPLLAPDLLGYDGTSKPLDAALYNVKSMTADLVEILDAEHIAHVITTGHDWGSYLAANMYLFHPSRCAGAILLNVAYMPPDRNQPFDLDASNAFTEKLFGYPTLAYWYLFTAPDGPQLLRDRLEAFYCALHGDVPGWMLRMFCKRDALREFVEADLRVPLKAYAQDKAFHDRFVERFKRDGFEAPTRWYLAMKDGHQYEVTKELEPERLKMNVPVLFIGCDGDAVCRTDMINAPKEAGLLPDLTVKELHSAHWSPYEVPDQIASTMVEWLEKREKDLVAKK